MSATLITLSAFLFAIAKGSTGCANPGLGYYQFTNEVYGCRGTFDGSNDNGIFGNNARNLCASNYAVCTQFTAERGGLTRTKCNQPNFGYKEFFGARYSSNGYNICGNPFGNNDIWGCGSQGAYSNCGPFTRRLGNANNVSPYPGWTYKDSFTEARTAVVTNSDNGGVLCCKVYDECDYCDIPNACTHDIDGSCTNKIPIGTCYPGSTLCTQLFDSNIGDPNDVCYHCTNNYPCKSNTYGDNECKALDQWTNQCPAGTTVCPAFTNVIQQPSTNPCYDTCTIHKPCLHNVNGDNTCNELLNHGGCPAGTTVCANLFPNGNANDPCFFCSTQYPCLHDTFGDNNCDSLTNGVCNPGTTICDDYKHLTYATSNELNVLKNIQNNIKSEIFYSEISIAFGVFVVGIISISLLLCCLNKWLTYNSNKHSNKKNYEFKQINNCDLNTETDNSSIVPLN